MVLLLQKEVAERIVAKPGNHSILSITTQFYADPEIVMYVPRDNFYPAPDVDSAVVKITPLPHPPHRGEGNENGSPSLDGRHPLLTSPSRGGEPGRFPSSRGGGRGRSRGDERPPSLDGTMSPPVFPSLDGRGKGRVVDEDKFFRLVKAGFAGKRKMLKNNLKSHTNLNVEKLLVDFGANPKARAQDLSLDDWKKLYDKVFNS